MSSTLELSKSCGVLKWLISGEVGTKLKNTWFREATSLPDLGSSCSSVHSPQDFHVLFCYGALCAHLLNQYSLCVIF